MNLFKLVHVGCLPHICSTYIYGQLVFYWSSSCLLLPPANVVWGKVIFYTFLSFCSQEGGCLPLDPGGVCLWVEGMSASGSKRVSASGSGGAHLGHKHLWTHTNTHGQSSFPPGHPFPCSDPLDTSPGHTHR